MAASTSSASPVWRQRTTKTLLSIGPDDQLVDLDLLVLVVHRSPPVAFSCAATLVAATRDLTWTRVKSAAWVQARRAAGRVGRGPRTPTGTALPAELHEHFAEGRLSLEELQRRLDLVFAAETLVDLYELTSDLPHPGPKLSGGGAVPPQAGSQKAWLVALRLRVHARARERRYIGGHQRKEVVQFMSSQRLGTLEVAGR